MEGRTALTPFILTMSSADTSAPSTKEFVEWPTSPTATDIGIALVFQDTLEPIAASQSAPVVATTREHALLHKNALALEE